NSDLLDVNVIRKDFPILDISVYGKPLIYFDNGATTQKPNAVIESISNYYKTYNSNVHRVVHYLSQVATDAQESARQTGARDINGANDREVNFSKGTTDGINLLAFSFGKKHLKPNDEVLITAMEHHSNIIPW